MLATFAGTDLDTLGAEGEGPTINIPIPANAQYPSIAAFTGYLPPGFPRELFSPGGSAGGATAFGGGGGPTAFGGAGGVAGFGGDPFPSGAPQVEDLELSNLTGDNDSINTAQRIPLGTAAGQESELDILGTLDVGDVDVYEMSLRAGDIIGINTKFGAGDISLQNPDGSELVGAQTDMISLAAPLTSPLPKGGVASVAYVIPRDGLYYLQLADGVSVYSTEVRTFRPVLESESVGTKQTLFIDFDGATVDRSDFGATGIARLSPLADFMVGFGLGPEDESAIIDWTLLAIEEYLVSDIVRDGNNGYFSQTGVPGDFDIEILNSRDHADPWGLPNVSRVVVGGTVAEFQIPTIGLAQSVDVGNFDTEETAVVLLDMLADPAVLATIPLAPGQSTFEMIGDLVGGIVAHEAGHFFANWHTDPFNDVQNIMDSGAGGFGNILAWGVDGILGNADDNDPGFYTEEYFLAEGQTGMEDTVNALAFGLSTGTVATEIRGVVYVDQNGNSRRDANELPLEGWTVYSDKNNNGLLDVGEPRAVSADDGTYSLFVEPGTHIVRQVVPINWNVTAPSGGFHRVTIGPEQIANRIDFGNRTFASTVSGTKWHDVDDDGFFDSTESGLANFLVYLDVDDDGVHDVSEPGAVTGPDGRYSFTVPFGGTYKVREVLKPGWAQNFPGSVSDFAHTLTFNGGDIYANINFGNSDTNGFDHGDAPAPYATLEVTNGPVHPIIEGFGLGLLVDGEADGLPTVGADGDDLDNLDDEDGVTFTTSLAPGNTAQIEVVISLNGQNPGVLQGWADFNLDGDFTDTGEHIVANRFLGEGTHTLAFPVPDNAIPGRTYARFRYSHDVGLGPVGVARDGEVEDYAVNVLSADPIANDDQFTVDQDSMGTDPPNQFDVLANDVPGISGQANLRLRDLDASNTQGTSGTVEVIRAGTDFDFTDDFIRYTPAPGTFGTDIFTYTIEDVQTGKTSTATVRVDIRQFVSTVPVAIDDSYSNVSTTRSLNILANDLTGINPPITISALDLNTLSTAGTVTLDPNATSVTYVPLPGFSGVDQFIYTIRDTDNVTDSAVVTVHVPPDTTNDVARFELRATDLDGNLLPDQNNDGIPEIGQGSQFQIRVFVDDLRCIPNTDINDLACTAHPQLPDNLDLFDQGLFSAYMDLLYNSNLVSYSGTQFNGIYNELTNVDVFAPGLLDEVGASKTTAPAPGPDPQLLFTATFTANQLGLAEFKSDPADVLPLHETAFFNPDQNAIDIDQIEFTEQAVQVVESADLVEISLEVTDALGNPLSNNEVAPGSTFMIRAFVDDLRDGFSQSVYSAYLDVLYDPTLARPVTVPVSPQNPFGLAISFGRLYNDGRNASVPSPGILNEVGAIQDAIPPVNFVDKELLFEMQFVALSPPTGLAQTFRFVADPADIQPLHEVSIPPDISVPTSQVSYVNSPVITVLGPGGEGEFTNPNNPFDVNNDGFVSPIDSLLVINNINQNGSYNLGPSGGEGESGPKYYYDVNADMSVSPIDVLQVINHLNFLSQGSGEGESYIELPLASAAVAVTPDASLASGLALNSLVSSQPLELAAPSRASSSDLGDLSESEVAATAIADTAQTADDPDPERDSTDAAFANFELDDLLDGSDLLTDIASAWSQQAD